MNRVLGPHARRDIRRGIEAGRFHVADAELAVQAMSGALAYVMRAVLDGRIATDPDPDVLHAEGVLRVLGLPAGEAAEVAGRPLPGSESD
jgi:hypothetical protein